MASKSRRITSVSGTTASQEEIEELKKQIAALTDQLKNIASQTPASKSKDVDYEDEEGEDLSIRISPDEYIKVMSVCPHQLNLTTQKRGAGKVFSFYKFGEVKRILYADLVNIMENHKNFLDSGVFIIMNKRVIRKHGLEEEYGKFLTMENFEKILSGNESDAYNLFVNANDRQRSFIIEEIINRAVKGMQVDLNLMDRLSRLVGYNIIEKIEDAKKMASILENKA